MYAHDATDHDAQPYNVAYVDDDRGHLYETFDVDPSQDAGRICPVTGEVDAPADYAERRDAILSFYGRRCGRCLTAIDTVRTDDAESGYLYSLEATTTDVHPDERWSLDRLVAVCEPCYEVLSIEDPDRLDAFGSAYRRSQQFPQWLGDPRVAVERIPLSGRELWIREQLTRRLSVVTSPGERSINREVADTACLAQETPAADAVAMGEELSTDAWQPMPTAQRLTERWEALDDAVREEYDRCAEACRDLVTSPSIRT